MKTLEICGFRVELSLWPGSGRISGATVWLGPLTAPGWRTKDGPIAVAARKEARRRVSEALCLPRSKVRAASRYTSDSPAGTVRFSPPPDVRAAESELWAWAEGKVGSAGKEAKP